MLYRLQCSKETLWVSTGSFEHEQKAPTPAKYFCAARDSRTSKGAGKGINLNPLLDVQVLALTLISGNTEPIEENTEVLSKKLFSEENEAPPSQDATLTARDKEDAMTMKVSAEEKEKKMLCNTQAAPARFSCPTLTLRLQLAKRPTLWARPCSPRRITCHRARAPNLQSFYGHFREVLWI